MIKLLKTFIKWPFIYKNEFLDGSELPQHNYCKDCSSKDCLNLNNYENHYYQCKNGFSCLSFGFIKDVIILNGLVLNAKNKNFVGKRRKIYKKYFINERNVEYIYSSLYEMEQYIAFEANARVVESVGFLHEIRTSVGIVLKWCEKIIDGQPGGNFESKIEKSNLDIGNLYKSINLLSEQINLSDVIVNPLSIKSGRKHHSKISGLIYKLIKLFEPRGTEKDCRIRFQGHTNIEIDVYNSFQLVPLILLDNAVKYSIRGRDIIIDLNEDGNFLVLEVSSYGQIIPKELRARIFEKAFRTPNAEKYVSKGMGMGLYIADLIVRAHDGTLGYECSLLVGSEGKNTFIVKLPKRTE